VYTTTKGDLNEIMAHIPHSTHDDEPRFITIITDLIKKKELKSTPTWKSSSKDEMSKMVRKKEAEKEAKEAEDLAKELGVWDEFYGTGKATERIKGKGKGKGKRKEGEETEGDEDHSALQTLILKKKEKNMDSFFDSLAAKYAEPSTKKGKNKKRGHDAAEIDESPRKKSRSNIPPPPELDDAEFAKLQQKLFGDKSGNASGKRQARKAK
jgi:DnaJ family protein C protein 9